jgi:hypothetical protein
MATNKQTLTIECDDQPLMLFTEIFESFLKRNVLFLDSCDLSFELARIDCDFSAASTSKLFVRFYPSDAFLSFAGAIFAGNFNFSAIKKVGHD